MTFLIGSTIVYSLGLEEEVFWWVWSQTNKPQRASNCKENSQNRINIHVLPFKTMEIMTICCFSSYECQGIQTKNPFVDILSLNFDFGPLKVTPTTLDMSQFCKGL
jgi:hypothetical protein